MESLTFRLSRELIEIAGYDIKYKAKDSVTEGIIEVWFQEPEEDNEDYALYKEEEVNKCLNDGDWIKVD